MNPKFLLKLKFMFRELNVLKIKYAYKKNNNITVVTFINLNFFLQTSKIKKEISNNKIFDKEIAGPIKNEIGKKDIKIKK